MPLAPSRLLLLAKSGLPVLGEVSERLLERLRYWRGARTTLPSLPVPLVHERVRVLAPATVKLTPLGFAGGHHAGADVGRRQFKSVNTA